MKIDTGDVSLDDTIDGKIILGEKKQWIQHFTFSALILSQSKPHEKGLKLLNIFSLDPSCLELELVKDLFDEICVASRQSLIQRNWIGRSLTLIQI